MTTNTHANIGIGNKSGWWVVDKPVCCWVLMDRRWVLLALICILLPGLSTARQAPAKAVATAWLCTAADRLRQHIPGCFRFGVLSCVAAVFVFDGP